MTATNQQTKPRMVKVFAFLLLLAVAGGAVAWRENKHGGQANDNMFPTVVAQRGPLVITVLVSGTIRARDQQILKNEVEGRTSIIFLIDEGTRVKQGDLLVELDASGMQDAKIDQEILVQNAEASFINARENLAVIKNQAESDTDQAKLTLDFSVQDLEKYVKGEYPNQLVASKEEITLREQELEVAKQRLEWSRKLAAEEYISETELRDDELKKQRAEQSVILAKNNNMLLEEYTHSRQMAQLNSNKKQADMALERIQRKARANVAQAEADLKAKEAEFKRQQDKLVKLDGQISKAKIYAPADGQVIYASTVKQDHHGSQQPLDEGQTVYERQELIYLPVGLASTVSVNVQEASLKKLQIGMPAIITVDALPGRRFLGQLDTISPLPDSQSMWMNPDLKVYSALINVDGDDPALRSGMSCKVELIVAQYEDAVYIPVQAVITESGQTCVYVMEKGGPKRRVIKIGLDNNRLIHVLEGIEEGEVVLREPPLKNAATDATNGLRAEPNTTQGVGDDFQSRIRRSLEELPNISPLPAVGPGSPDGSKPEARPAVNSE